MMCEFLSKTLVNKECHVKVPPQVSTTNYPFRAVLLLTGDQHWEHSGHNTVLKIGCRLNSTGFYSVNKTVLQQHVCLSLCDWCWTRICVKQVMTDYYLNCFPFQDLNVPPTQFHKMVVHKHAWHNSSAAHCPSTHILFPFSKPVLAIQKGQNLSVDETIININHALIAMCELLATNVNNSRNTLLALAQPSSRRSATSLFASIILWSRILLSL